jgi:hypothetical protein
MTFAYKPSLKQGKYILAAAMIAGAMNLSFAENMIPGVPGGWQAFGALGEHFDIGIDPGESVNGQHAIFIASKGAAQDKFAAISQTIDVTAWQGKTARFTVMAKTQEPANYGEVFLRGTTGQSKSYNAVSTTNIKGVEWKEVVLMMDIPKQITQLEFGVGLRQQGKIWVRDVKIAPVVTPPKTEHARHNSIAEQLPMREPSAAPLNLDFSQ